MSEKKIVAVDYKGKWFVLCDAPDEDDYVRNEVDTTWVAGDGLEEHVANCDYYGIPAYIGDNAELHARIKALQDKLNPEEIISNEIEGKK